MVVPLAANSVSVLAPATSAVAPRRTLTVVPTASAIWLARVRCQIIRYSASSWPFNSPARASGERSGVVGRMASWASCAFLILPEYWRGPFDRNCGPYALPTSERTAARASSLRTTLSVRM